MCVNYFNQFDIIKIFNSKYRYLLEYIDNPYFNSMVNYINQKVQAGNDQEKAQSEKDSHSKNRGGKNLN